MSSNGIDSQIERCTKKINELKEKLNEPNISHDEKRILESKIKTETEERTKWKIRKNNQFTTRHKNRS
jgi:hypothetical protein